MTPVGETVASERIEMWVSVGGHQYVLQMGPWVMGEFSPRASVSAAGTSKASITRNNRTEWIIAAPKGSLARLSNYDDVDAPVDKGLYEFDFVVRATRLVGSQC